MQVVINDETYGTIVYNESAWTGRKSFSINGTPLTKTAKNVYSYTDGTEQKSFTLQGNFLRGSKLLAGDKVIQLTPPVKWYEIAMSVVIFVLIIVWGNSVALCSIVPVVGGAIGGAISGVFMVFNLLIIKRIKNIWLKALVSIGMCAACFAVCMLIGFAIVGAVVW